MKLTKEQEEQLAQIGLHYLLNKEEEPKKILWQQTPEGRKKISRVMKRAWNNKRSNK